MPSQTQTDGSQRRFVPYSPAQVQKNGLQRAFVPYSPAWPYYNRHRYRPYDPQDFQYLQDTPTMRPPQDSGNTQGIRTMRHLQDTNRFYDAPLDDDHLGTRRQAPQYPHDTNTPAAAAPSHRDSIEVTASPHSLGPDYSRSDLDLTTRGAMSAHSTPNQDTTATANSSPDPEDPPQHGPGGDPEKNFQPKDLRFWPVMLSNFVAIFLVALDRTILATAIPRISDDFGSLGDIGWYGSAYMLTTAASQLIFGRVYKFYDIKWTYMAVIIAFEVGSVICAAAPTSFVFIIGRAVAGFGSAGIFSGSMMIMIPMVPLPKRPMFQSIFGLVFGLASVIGPLLGGVFTSALTWRWCFWINLPVGGVALFCLIFFLHVPRRKPGPPVPWKTHVLRLDPLGTLFFLPSIVALLLALQWGGAMYAWNDARVVALFVVFAVMFVGFAAVQVLMPETATVPLRIIRQRSMLAGACYMIFLSGAMMMAIYYVPLWFQTVLGADPIKSGLYTIPLVLSIVVSSIISGVATQKLGYYVPSMLLCPVIMAVGEGLLSTFSPTTSSSRWIAYEFLTGFGLGFGMQTVNLAVQTVFQPEDVSTGIAISFFAQQLGAAIFVSVGQSILNNVLAAQLIAANIPGYGGDEGGSHAVVETGATDLLNNVEERFRPRVVEALNYACTRVFLTGMGLAVATFMAAAFMEWKSIKKAQPGAQGTEGSEGGSSGSSQREKTVGRGAAG